MTAERRSPAPPTTTAARPGQSPSRPAPRSGQPAFTALLAVVLTFGLAACSDDAPPPQPTQTAPVATQPVAPVEAPPETVQSLPPETEEQLNARADAAVQEQRLFAPPGDNAFELYVSVAESNPDHTFARNALTDLFPYAVMHVEQRLAARDADEAGRVLSLMERANETAPALPRLRKELEALRTRAAADAAAELARQERAAQEAAAAAAAAAAASAPEPEPEAEPAVARTTPPPTSTAPASAATASTSAPTPPEAQPTRPTPPPAPPRLAPGELPKVVRMSQPRYPPLALRRGLEGFVEVSFTVEPDGSVSDVSIVRSEPGNIFNREAISAMQDWKFEASGQTSEGRRVFDFKLAKE